MCLSALYQTIITLATGGDSDIEIPLYITLGLTMLSQWHYILCVINEMTIALNIRVFCVKDKKASHYFDHLQ